MALPVTAAATAAADQDPVVIVQDSEPSTLDPCYSGSICELNIIELIMDTVVTLDEDQNIIPNLATKWEVSEDNLSWTFTLREDVYFSDGVQLTANDVKYTFDRTMDPDNQCTGNYLWCIDGMYYEEIEVVDDFTFIVHTSEPCPCMPTYMADICVIPQHYYEGLDKSEASVAPLGSGAYVLESWDTVNNIVTLTKNHDWWKEKSGESAGDIETLVWKSSSEESSRVADLVSGGCDVINNVSTDFAAQVEASANYVSTEGSRREYIGITENNGNTVNNVTEFRQALNYAIDVQTIIDTLRGGAGTRTGTFVAEPYSDPDCLPYDYDPEMAAALMEEAGIIDSDGDGYVEYNGEKVHLVLAATGHYSKDTEIMTAVGSYLDNVGIENEVLVIEWSTFNSQANDYEIEADLWFRTSGSVCEVQTDLTDFLSNNSANYGVWNNDEYDALFAELANTFDEEERYEKGYELQQLMREEAPVIFFDFATNAYGVSDKITWTPTKDGRMHFHEATYN